MAKKEEKMKILLLLFGLVLSVGQAQNEDLLLSHIQKMEERLHTLEEKTENFISDFTYLGSSAYSAGGKSYLVKEYKHELTGIEFVLIPSGGFKMGSNSGNKDEKPIHDVNVPSFLISKYEVTQAQWKQVMGSKPWFGKSYVKEGSEYAANYISWDDAKEFCQKTGLRLPSEAEWEYACRAGTTTDYYWGDRKNINDYAWWDGNADNIEEDYAHKVGIKKPNAFGLHDMSGNVWEWCEDKYERSYDNAPTDGSAWTKEGSNRVYRGGSWHNNAWDCRSAKRDGYTPGIPHKVLGLRLARSFFP